MLPICNIGFYTEALGYYRKPRAEVKLHNDNRIPAVKNTLRYGIPLARLHGGWRSEKSCACEDTGGGGTFPTRIQKCSATTQFAPQY